MDPITVTHNQERSGAILHINCQSDGSMTKWPQGKEEEHRDAQKSWLVKLGCMLKVYQGIKYKFNDPWKYALSNFPEGYKLFAVERREQGGNQPRKDYYLCGGKHKYRSPSEFYPHVHWLLEKARGGQGQCICQYCDSSRPQEEINKIFPLPPSKESAKQSRRTKSQKQTKKVKGPKGVTSKRGLVVNRNSITTGPLATLGHNWQGHKVIGHKRSHPFGS